MAGRRQRSATALNFIVAMERYLAIIEVLEVDFMSQENFSDQVRAAVRASGFTQYRIAKELKIAESTMSRFMSGKGGLSMETLDRLAALLGLRIVTGTRKDR